MMSIKVFTFSTIAMGYLLVALMISSCSAQLGTEITAPAFNSTVNPGDKVEIDFEYQNIGSGDYSVNIDLWTDNTLNTVAKNIVENHPVKSGNSTGTQLSFLLNSTYTFTVPNGLNESCYLTVITTAKTGFNNRTYTMRSKGVLLHVSAGIMNLPIHHFGLLAVSFAVLYFIGGF